MTTQPTHHEAESATDPDPDTDRLRSVVIGQCGFERATVWSAVGFGLVLGAIALVNTTLLPPTVITLITVGIITVVMTAIVAFAWVGGGLGPCIVLAAGPLIPMWVGVQPLTPSATSVIESVASSLVLTLAVGILGYLVGSGGGRLSD